ncbi:tetratricopeptide repeat-containing serine protease family protein [Magnetospirillum sp. UT-4]|uniref:tetratricopeptide repeat-containing serine protease family protein n=1 Tax=Magnetospirillum sp. UT-4 TaxID=2681467 RepID=UPI00137CC817|nr:tetratricopeptide repeat-containing serine protease family protein [Magnetospirillum sp. UT-4]CAA7618081.1 TPR repeat protein [Magnetospirillum sp. UT-4]
MRLYRHGSRRVIPAAAFAALLLAAAPVLAGVAEGETAFARRDWATALKELQPHAESGHVGAMSRVGHIYLNGFGVPADPAKALPLLTQAAEKGDALAQNTLGGLYFQGRGVAKDMDRALLWISRAADQNQPNALNNLGQFHYLGTGLPKDEAKGLTYLRRAADLGISAAMETIGIAHWHGRGVPQDRATAVTWLKKAAERGHMVSQNLYGAALWNGDGTARNPGEAVKWFERSGMQGDAPSLFNAGVAHFSGTGVPKDAEKAYVHLVLAERLAKPNQKQQFADYRDKIRATLSPEQEQRAMKQVAAWKPVKGTPVEAGAEPAAAAGPAAPQPAPPRPKNGAGSGFVVARDGTVLTNSHVVQSCRNIRVVVEGGTSQAASVIARDAATDLAALKTSLVPAEVARFREDKPLRSGDSVVAVGYPLSSLLSREPNVTAGVISAMAGVRGDVRHYQLTAPIQRGNSGGPVADMSGNVIGVVVSTLNAQSVAEKTGAIPQNVNFAIKAQLARKFLSDNGIPFQTAPSTATLSPADVGDLIRKVTVFVECEG